MSEFHINVVKVGPLEKHPNADTLLLTKVAEYPILVKAGDLNEGDLAVYIPVDSVVPADDHRFAFLKGHERIKARRLRGVFSMGLLIKADPDMVEGQDVAERLRITKYEPPETCSTGGDNEKDPGIVPVYTDLDAYRRYPNVIQDGEIVQLTEKLHGVNGRYAYFDNRLWCGSHHGIKKESPNSIWWKAAEFYNLREKLATVPGVVLYGEVYGSVQNLHYGHTKGAVSLAFFDAFSISAGQYLDVDQFEALMKQLDLPMVPKLHNGPWSKELLKLAEGKTLISDDHVREGFVVRPVKERWDKSVGRVILKYHGEGYLTR